MKGIPGELNRYRLQGNKLVRVTDKSRKLKRWDGVTLPEIICCTLPYT
jgi:hypothetical protein